MIFIVLVEGRLNAHGQLFLSISQPPVLQGKPLLGLEACLESGLFGSTDENRNQNFKPDGMGRPLGQFSSFVEIICGCAL